MTSGCSTRELEIDPEPAELRWLHDVFGNSVGDRPLRRPRRAACASTARSRLEHTPDRTSQLDVEIEDYARHYPFTYSPEDMPDLLRSIERQHPDPHGEVDGWARRFVRPMGRPTRWRPAHRHDRTRSSGDSPMCTRLEKGTQTPLETLERRSGSCRDFAMLMIEAVRALGFAARFVSGYVYSPLRASDGRVGGGNTHAWVRVYLPGCGWVEFDPTNGIVGNRDLIRVADRARSAPGGAAARDLDRVSAEAISAWTCRGRRRIGRRDDATCSPPASCAWTDSPGNDQMRIRAGYEITYECRRADADAADAQRASVAHKDLETPRPHPSPIPTCRSTPLSSTASATSARRITCPPAALTLSLRLRDRAIGSRDADAAPDAPAAAGRGPARRRARLPAGQPLLRDRPADRPRLVAVRRHPRRAGRGSRRSSTYVHEHIDVRLPARPRRPRPPARAIEEQRGVCRDFAHLAITLVPLHEHPGALLHRLSGRHRRAAGRRADGFLRLVRGLSRRRAGTRSTRATTSRASAAS